MSTVEAIRGWRYDPGKADPALVAAPFPRALDPDARRALYASHPRNVARLLPGGPSSAQDREASGVRAAAHLSAWRAEGLFVQDRSSVYLVEWESPEGVSRWGALAGLLLEERIPEGSDNEAESTGAAGPSEEEWLLHLRVLRGGVVPVSVAVEDAGGDLADCLAELAGYEPAASGATEDGAWRMWVVDHSDRARRFCRLVAERAARIPDRGLYNAAVAYRDEVRAAFAAAGRPAPAAGALESDQVLALLFPDSADAPAPPPVPCGLALYLFW